LGVVGSGLGFPVGLEIGGITVVSGVGLRVHTGIGSRLTRAGTTKDG